MFTRIKNKFYTKISEVISNTEPINKQDVNQVLLIATYKSLNIDSSFRIKDSGFSVYSQHEEDGMLLFVFSLINTTNKKCIEICAGTGKESNTANLIINHRWEGLLFDGESNNILAARNFYLNNKHTKIWPPIIKQEWITIDNINELIEKSGFKGEIDLLSIDIDGIDYWLWKSINVVNPRLVIIEFNHLWGSEKSVTVPYDSSFKAIFTEYGSDYAGASLSAMVKLGHEKGYKLIGTNAFATNAIFLRKDIQHSLLPENKTEECFSHSRAIFGMQERIKNIHNLKWIEV
jgi:hypothetical protein